MSTETPDQPLAEQTKLQQQRLALTIKTVWAALIKPNWTSDELIALGKAVYSKQALAAIDGALFQRIFPHLQSIGTDLLSFFDQERVEEMKRKLNETHGKDSAPPAGPRKKEDDDAV
ncbi:MAG TPA: hypothetical protein VMS77_05395 [Conexivisphaerales archaeon]|nr:hypothetical protein [Conexivisphaerales archaeon]